MKCSFYQHSCGSHLKLLQLSVFFSLGQWNGTVSQSQSHNNQDLLNILLFTYQKSHYLFCVIHSQQRSYPANSTHSVSTSSDTALQERENNSISTVHSIYSYIQSFYLASYRFLLLSCILEMRADHSVQQLVLLTVTTPP